MSPLEFEELLRVRADELAQRGICALEPMYDLVASRLLRYAATLTRTREEAEDVLQSSLLRLARGPQKLSTANRPWSYLLKLTRNEAYDLLYRKKPLELLPATSVILDSSEPAFDSWEKSELVQQAMQELPAAQAEVVILKIWEGMTFREISELTEESLSTVTSRYRYAMEKLSSLLSMYAQEPKVSSVVKNRD